MLQKCLQCICFPGTAFQMLIYSLPSAWFWWLCQVAGQNYDLFAVRRMAGFAALKSYAERLPVIAA